MQISKSSMLIYLSFLLLSLATTCRITNLPLTLCFFSLFFTLFAVSLNYWLVPGGFAWRNYHNPKQKLAGPTGWPVLGTLPEMGSLAHRKLAAMANSLHARKLMAFSLGANRVIISSHPDTAKEILSGRSFSDRPIKESARLLMFERAIGFAPSGDYWRNLRKIATTHMFSPRRICSLEPIRRRLADEMVEQVKNSNIVFLREILQKGSLSNVLESVFGNNLRKGDEEELSLMVKEGYELISKFNLEDYFGFKFLDFYGVKRKCFKLACKVNGLVGEIVRERKGNGEFSDGNDFLSALLSLSQHEQLAEADMVSVLWEMIFRGTDTIAILLEWIMARIVMHQDIQEKAQQEIDTCTGRNRHVQDSDIPNLPYLQAIVKEVLRMHPPGPLLSWARLAIQDVHVDKIFIPAGTTAMVNMWAITHDPSVWKNPFEFNPDRFLEEDVAIMGSDLRLAPFGSGRRVCPGKALGLATVHLWLGRLLQEYKWLPGKPVDLSECLRLSLEMKQPLACYAVAR
ncbi:cytochrome P450 78A5-like [Mercurialis annua]|uniref:cytochrome P450 78A5-like n=1 Tax=Mercurialis annua TaxID=3986 RepID=UPI00215EFBDB|nr:cytochrome P450 78A5-like [Mercurialis annua]